MPPSPASAAQATVDRAAAEVRAAASPVTDAASPDAVARLAASRARLKGAMTGPPKPPKPTAGTSSGKPLFSTDGLASAARKLRARALALPGADVLSDAVDVWWKGHPLHTAGVVAGEAGDAYMRPIARRSPYAFVLTAAATGALFWWSRPWRWALRPMLLAGLVPQIASQALRRMPASSWTRVLDMLVKPSRRTPAGTARADPAATI